jgi:hypothetical protein
MEKISSILPATPRITAVDLKNSGVARSGTNPFGRDVGLSSIDRRKALEAALPKGSGDAAINETGRPLDPRAAIVKDMADKFFGEKIKNYSNTTQPAADVIQDKLQAATKEAAMNDIELRSERFASDATREAAQSRPQFSNDDVSNVDEIDSDITTALNDADDISPAGFEGLDEERLIVGGRLDIVA